MTPGATVLISIPLCAYNVDADQVNKNKKQEMAFIIVISFSDDGIQYLSDKFPANQFNEY
jgi:hypothetical protein